MALGSCFIDLKFQTSGIMGTGLNRPNIFLLPSANEQDVVMGPLTIQAKVNQRTESPMIRNRRLRIKFNGTATRPRLSVFCSEKQLYAMLVDDQKKKCLFYGSTLQKSMRSDPSCTTVMMLFATLFVEVRRDDYRNYLLRFWRISKAPTYLSNKEAAKCVGEELIKTCVDLNINEISSYDRNGLARGERMQAFETVIGSHGFLPR